MEDKRRLYLLVDGRDDRIRYIGISNDPRRRHKDHCGDTSAWLKHQWILELRRLHLRPVLVDCGPSTVEEEFKWVRVLRKRCDLLNTAAGDLWWARGQGPRGIEVAAYADLIKRLAGGTSTELRRPHTSWRALRQGAGNEG